MYEVLVIQLTPLLGYPMHLQSMLHIRFSTLPAYRINACGCWKRLGPFPTLSCSTGPLLQASCRDPASVLPPGVPFLGEPCWSMLCVLGSTPRTVGRTVTHTHTHTHTNKQTNTHTHTHKIAETRTRTLTHGRIHVTRHRRKKQESWGCFNFFLCFCVWIN
jgi:ABC-type nickel/cobalt efflux system permease component RcnA